MYRLFLILVIAFAAFPAYSQNLFSVDDLLNVDRVGDAQLSPSGTSVAYTIGVVNKEDNRVLTQIYTVSLDGSNKMQITDGKSSSSSPRWSPSGDRIAFTTGGQIWTMSPNGENKKQITDIATGAGNPVWSPDGTYILFNSEVYPECKTDECNEKEDERVENSKVKAKVSERLLFKHWNEWRDRKRSHVFIVSADGGVSRDLTPGDFDSPPYSASTGTDYAFSPDSKEVVFIKNLDEIEALSTNSDIFVMPVEGGNTKNITENNKGYDASPVYTSDGKYIIFLSQERATFEADRWRVMRFNRATGETVELTQGFDQHAHDIILSNDDKNIYFSAGVRGRSPIFSVPVEPDFRLKIATHVKQVVDKVSAGSLNISPDEKTLVFTSSSTTNAPEVFKANVSDGAVSAVTSQNTAKLAAFKMKPVEDMDWTGAVRSKVHGFLVKPADFDETKKYPVIVLIHGGPQGAWNDSWSYRWNPQIFANQGFVVFMPNPRGSTGYGQKFVDDISGDWGGKVYTDIMNGVVEVSKLPYVDKEKIGAAGASYGGYMVDWLLGHNDHPQVKFKAFVSHAGVYNLESMAATTEELFFVNWEFKGMPWENPVNYNKWSPHKFVKKFSTPTLVTHGELDFRVPIDQSLQLFTALQLQKVDSKIVIFPDEGHWILKPQNSEFWHDQVLGWLNGYLK